MVLASLLLPLVLTGAAPVPGREAQQREEAQRHFEAGERSMREESFERAVQEFKAAIELDPLLVLAHYDLGQSYMVLKEYPRAVEAYLGCRQALAQVNALGRSQLAEREQEIDDQIRDLQDLVRRWGSAKNPNAAAQILMAEERIRVLEGTRRKKGGQAVAEPPGLALALGSAHFRQGSLEDAEREYTQAAKADDKLGAAHNNLAVIYMLSGRFAESRAAVQKAERAGLAISPAFKSELESRERAAAAKP